MRLYLLISVLIGSASAQCRYCSGACVFEKYQNLRLLKNGLMKVFDMAYSAYLDTVFFTYDDINEPHARRLGYVKLADGTTSYIEGIQIPHGLSINLRDHVMYIGSADGLYKIPLFAAVLKPVKIDAVGLVGVPMTSVFYYNNYVYFIAKEGVPNKLELDSLIVESAVVELDSWIVDKLVIDKFGNILYIDNQDGCVYRIEINSKERTQVPNTDKVTDIAIDIDSNAYIAKPDGIYKYHGLTDELSYMGDNLDNVQKMTFQTENVPIFKVDDKILTFYPKRERRSVHNEF